MTIEPKLMMREDVASYRDLADRNESQVWGAPVVRLLLAHIAAQDLKIAKLEDELRSNGEALRDNFIGEDDDEHNDLVRMGSQMIRLADGLTP